ncbi:cytochrome P450 2J4-like [Amphiura filiformis]|uniref:cytochrome P450 2J4-like n=1 Tax=Amphiura filiformis TaxID=82378 RepID=UPI003B2160C3
MENSFPTEISIVSLFKMALDFNDIVNVKSVLVLGLSFLLVAWWKQRPRNLPPGPWRLPIIGFVPQLMWSMFYKQEEMHLLATRLGQKYGKIYSFDLFGLVFVVINDFSIMKEGNNNPLLSDKGHNNELEKRMLGSSLHSYKHMVEFRKFTLAAFRGFGMGKHSFHANIEAESMALLEELDALKGSPCNPHHFLIISVSNILFNVVFGKRHDYNDDNFRNLTNMNNRIMHLLGSGMWSVFLPKYYPTKDADEMLNLVQKIYDFVDTLIEEHTQDFDAENPKDFIDVYLKTMKETPKTDDPFSYLKKDNMRAGLYNVFLGGTTTSTTTLDWCCLYMMAHPDIQEKIQREIDSVVGRNRLPRISDQAQLPYTRATLLEIQRHAVLAPLSDFHTASADTTLYGYRIPKGATIVSNIFAVMKDPKVFPEPDRFKPERFINEHGYFEKEEVCPFGVGRRICIGETLAKMEIFIFFAHLLHRYSLVKPDDASPVTLEGNYGATFAPKSFTTKFVPRE